VLYLIAHLATYIAAIYVIVILAQRGHRNPLLWALIGGVGSFVVMFGGSILVFYFNPDDPSGWPLPAAYAWLGATILFVKYRPSQKGIF
jgi:hypothetical protein